jgi:uncharacterized membrane protein YkoI
MSSISATNCNKAGMAVMLIMLVSWMLPAQAGRQRDDRLQLAQWANGQYQGAGNRKYADSAASNGQRYPPRHNNSYENPGYSNERSDRRNSNARGYDSRNSSGSYSDGESVTEQRQYYNGKRAPYASESRGNRRPSDDRKPVTEQRQYQNGKRAPYSPESRGNRRPSGDREPVTEQRQYQNGKRAPYSSESRGNRRPSGDREPVAEQRQYQKGRRAPYSSESQGKGRSSDGHTGRRRDASLEDAVSRVRRQSDARVLSAETVRKNDREEHRVRIITDDGRVRRYRMDAETGDLLPRKR